MEYFSEVKSGMVLCEVCRRREARYVCRICGREVCGEHYDPARGICAICSETMCTVCGTRLAVDSCAVCGRLICRQCSVELQPGIRVCGNCYEDLPKLIGEDLRLSYLAKLLKRSQDPGS